MNSMVDEVVRESDDQMDKSPPQGGNLQNFAASDVAFSIKEKMDKVLTCIVEAKQTIKTLSYLVYATWESFQGSKSAKQALTMENLNINNEIAEAFTRRNNEDKNLAPITTTEVNRKVDMRMKAMKDLIFGAKNKATKIGPSTQDARSGTQRERNGEGPNTRHKNPQSSSQRKDQHCRSKTPMSARGSKSTRYRSSASTKSVGHKQRRSTDNKTNKRGKRPRRRIKQKSSTTKSAVQRCTAGV